MSGRSGKQLVRRCNGFHWPQCRLVRVSEVAAPSSFTMIKRDSGSMDGQTQSHGPSPTVLTTITLFAGLAVALCLYFLARYIRAPRAARPDRPVGRWRYKSSRRRSRATSSCPSTHRSRYVSVRGEIATPPPLPAKDCPRVNLSEVISDFELSSLSDDASRRRSTVASEEPGPSRGHGARARWTTIEFIKVPPPVFVTTDKSSRPKTTMSVGEPGPSRDTGTGLSWPENRFNPANPFFIPTGESRRSGGTAAGVEPGPAQEDGTSAERLSSSRLPVRPARGSTEMSITPSEYEGVPF